MTPPSLGNDSRPFVRPHPFSEYLNKEFHQILALSSSTSLMIEQAQIVLQTGHPCFRFDMSGGASSKGQSGPFRRNQRAK
ncbi:hypothetical protein A6V36_05525 [Paraburkholderia ginsengiterrae]|uniref:Uncharacterized protein n=1 Tax=Paraburkholderia ginsengiterrae TaxID=1462993 RepID=A0A1A9NHI5_9BURK|nr:hypothetical protein A6V36_05525 [Paraburkholderia ginsengiterrae]OAJ65604.1 hypothetical protein A6V37_13545 [Paraburkholderia ginsengiterrae]